MCGLSVAWHFIVCKSDKGWEVVKEKSNESETVKVKQEEGNTDTANESPREHYI